MSEPKEQNAGQLPNQAQSTYEAGLAARRAVLGDAYVDNALAQATPFDADFQRFVTEVAWGSVWARPGLDRSTRSLVTIAVLAALGRTDELELHLRASRNAGVTPDHLREALLHVAVYAGMPAGRTAFLLAKRALETAGPLAAPPSTQPQGASQNATEAQAKDRPEPGTL